MLKMGDKVRMKSNMELSDGKESITLIGSDPFPSRLTLVCCTDEKDGYVDVAGYGVGAHLSVERLRPETPDDLDY